MSFIKLVISDRIPDMNTKTSKGFIEIAYTIQRPVDLDYLAMRYFAETSNPTHSHRNSMFFESTGTYSPGPDE